jgi:hypothetical protein
VCVSSLREKVREQRLVDDEDLAALKAWPPYAGASLAERLYRSGLVSDVELCGAFVALGAVDGTDDLLRGMPPPAALGALTRAQAERHRAVGLRVERARLVVAMLDPSDTEAIERIAFFSGLAVEPRACRPRVLFSALRDAYGVPMVLPDAAFLDARGRIPAAESRDDRLPAPAPDVPERSFLAPGQVPAPARSADPHRSPLAASVVSAASDELFLPPKTDPIFVPQNVRPARSPPVPSSALEEIRRKLPLSSPLEARDSLPPQVLRLLVPPLRSAVLFLVRDVVAVGWDGRAPTKSKEDIRDVLLPLTAPSAFARAFAWKRVAVGNPADPTTVERIFLGHLRLKAPSSFAVLPIVVGDDVVALLYLDRHDGALDDTLLDSARQVGGTLADGLAPFVAARELFPSIQLPPL